MRRPRLAEFVVRSKRREYFSNVKLLTFMFQLLSMGLVLLNTRQALTVNSLVFSGLLIGLTYLSNVLVQRYTKGDNYLIMIANMLFSIGIVMIYRINPALGERQLLLYTIGVGAFFIAYYFLHYTGHFWENKTFFFLGISIAMLAVTLVFGRTLGGATNWIEVAGFQFQPSEFTKITFAFFIAAFYANHAFFKQKLGGSLFLMIATYILIGIFFLQGELGTAIVFFAAMICAMIAFDRSRLLLFANIGLALAGLFVAYRLFGHIQVRFEVWLDPWADPDGRGYQILQSMFAVASGGLFGRGIGLGQPGTIPLAHSDFIFASIIEEMGIFMGIAISLLYLIVFYRGLKISLSQTNPFYKVLALVISMMFAAQAAIVIGGVLKLIPLTGMVLPFMAHGGSSLLASFVMLGALQYSSVEQYPEVALEIKE
ncbi:MAG TPA: FtsW/RodA/SpoVE family cell cycle protein [Tissierellia bacterium]|nr:FtsW/RodA/SpoVE family cell cycle protein [Tissierellia bacterium]